MIFRLTVVSEAPKADYVLVLFGLSGIRVIAASLCLYVADCPADKDCD